MNFLLSVFFLITMQFFSLVNATTVLLWEPDVDNTYGHATVQTKTYHISLWPDGDVKNDFGVWNTLTKGVPGSLNFHHQLDYILEGKRKPKQYFLEKIPALKVDQAYEEMLEYNDITPDRVTLNAGEEQVLKKIKPEISLSKSLYSFKGGGCIKDGFYKYPQSCTTFSASLLNIANEGIVEEYLNRVSNIKRDEFLWANAFVNMNGGVGIEYAGDAFINYNLEEAIFKHIVTVTNFKACIEYISKEDNKNTNNDKCNIM